MNRAYQENKSHKLSQQLAPKKTFKETEAVHHGASKLYTGMKDRCSVVDMHYFLSTKLISILILNRTISFSDDPLPLLQISFVTLPSPALKNKKPLHKHLYIKSIMSQSQRGVNCWHV